MSLYLGSVWPSQSEPAALGSGGHRGSAGSAGCRHWSNRPDWQPGGRAPSAANGRSACFLKDRKRLNKNNRQEVWMRWKAGELTAADGVEVWALRVHTESSLHPPLVLLPSSSHSVHTNTCNTETRFSLQLMLLPPSSTWLDIEVWGVRSHRWTLNLISDWSAEKTQNYHKWSRNNFLCLCDFLSFCGNFLFLCVSLAFF